MPTVACVFAHWAMGKNQAVIDSSQQSDYGFLNLFDWERHLVGLIIQLRHLAHRPQLLQNPAELWCTVRIGCSAKSHNPPMKLRMSQNVAAAPECLVVGVGDDNSGAWTRHLPLLIERDGAQFLIPKSSTDRRGCAGTNSGLLELF
jgi:hypothetical protein